MYSRDRKGYMDREREIERELRYFFIDKKVFLQMNRIDGTGQVDWGKDKRF